MRTMKDSGIEWIGEIPEDWEVCKLKYLAKVQTGNTPSMTNEELFFSKDKGIPWIKAENLNNYYSIEKTELYLTVAGKQEGRIFPKNTVFVCCIASVGKVGFSCIEASCNQQINGLSFNDRLCWKYGFYLSKAQEEEYLLLASGNVVKILNSERQKNIFCTLPSLSEQQRIVDFLDDKVSQIDSTISKTRESIEEYKKLKQAIITEAVTKGLNPNAKMKNSGIEWIGDIPEEWECFYLSQIFTPVKNKNIGLIENNLLSLSYGKIIRKNIETTFGLLPENFEGYNIIQENDIVLRLTDLQNDHKSLRVGIAKEKGIITSAYLTLRNQTKKFVKYFYYLLHSFDIAKGFYGMGAGVRQGLNWSEIRSLRMIAPKDISEQQQIADYLDQKCSEIDALITKKEQLVVELETYKKSLIYEVVTGKRSV